MIDFPPLNFKNPDRVQAASINSGSIDVQYSPRYEKRQKETFYNEPGKIFTKTIERHQIDMAKSNISPDVQ